MAEALPEPGVSEPPAGGGPQMTFAEHLDELRRRVMLSVIVLFGLFMVCFFLYEHTMRVFIAPFERIRRELGEDGIDIGPLTFIDPLESFTFALKIAFYSAIVLGMPVMLYQMWAFIAAGLHLKERKAVMRVLPVSMGMFGAGALFAYLLVVPIALKFLLSFGVAAPGEGGDPLIQPDIRLETYLSFILMLCLLLGGIFQLPLVQVVLARFGIMPAKTQAKKRKAFIMTAVVVCAIITPTGDALTLILVAGPMLVLFEIGLLIARQIRVPDGASVPDDEPVNRADADRHDPEQNDPDQRD